MFFKDVFAPGLTVYGSGGTYIPTVHCSHMGMEGCRGHLEISLTMCEGENELTYFVNVKAPPGKTYFTRLKREEEKNIASMRKNP